MLIRLQVLLFVDTIIIVAVERTRHEEMWVGIASVICTLFLYSFPLLGAWVTYHVPGALLMTIWALAADRTVQWGKTEEEERLTGRAETRRTLLEWTEVLFSSIVLLILAIVVVLLTLTLILRALDANLAPPGTRFWVDGDKYQLHLYCHGNKTDPMGKTVPTVLFEGGEDPVEYGLWQFADSAVKNGSILRYCFADRPGKAWVRPPRRS